MTTCNNIGFINAIIELIKLNTITINSNFKYGFINLKYFKIFSKILFPFFSTNHCRTANH